MGAAKATSKTRGLRKPSAGAKPAAGNRAAALDGQRTPVKRARGKLAPSRSARGAWDAV